MATISQIRGMLLEEAILYLLRASGYQTIGMAASDPTLCDGSAGLEVRGRGGQHQIDAIADYLITQPFSFPQRLLVEAKCYAAHRNVGLPIIRNAVGVLKDVQEYWSSSQHSPFNTRYHYLYALFSAFGFTSPAEKYAFAQDIYLMPLAESQFIRPVIDAILTIGHRDFRAPAWNEINVDMTRLRLAVRNRTRDTAYDELRRIVNGEAATLLENFCNRCRTISGAVFGMIGRRFPVFLVPSPQINIADLTSTYDVRIYWDQEGWYLRSREDGALLFSFDLPLVLFSFYADRHGILTQERAFDLKADFLLEIQATVMVDDQARLTRFRLDQQWLEEIRTRFEARSRETEENGESDANYP